MAYPKKKATLDMNTKVKEPKMSEERGQRLLALQQREEMKGMLVNKFISKYGKENKSAINEKVDKFMRDNKMSQPNL